MQDVYTNVDSQPVALNNTLEKTTSASYSEDDATINSDVPVINPNAAHVGPNTSEGKGNWFAGTSWG
jgi:hypothetical protein